MDTRLKDVVPENPLARICCGCSLLLGIILISLFAPASVIQLDRLHFGLAKNGVTGVVDMATPLAPGRYYLGFWMEIITFPSTLNTIEFSDEKPEEGVQHMSVLRSRDRDGKRIFLDVSVQYRLMQNSVGTIYSNMLTFYEDVFISELRNELAIACNKFAIDEAWTDYDKVTQIMQTACENALSPHKAECWGLQLWGIRLESKYEQALIKTQVRKQAQITEENRKRHSLVRAETQVMLAEYKKNKTIIEAQGEADRFLITEEAKANASNNLIDAQAKSAEIVRRIVQVAKDNATMNDDQMVEYLKWIMLQRMTDTNFIIHSSNDKLSGVNAKALGELAKSTLS
eukprot:TRINITY_DN109354_c0_g1_i1.p1 TRINITY_DN109354_c0_g1~~TRINITY_DN109354_c0_g1_i1.p1  ORF type:complete len:343 (+),score=64.46 TRINITY_DN109354_c0_g1_i1:87-1115(+)